MFGIGGSEILVILIVALLFLGPDKLPGAAKQISKGIRELKKGSRAIQETIENDETVGGAIRDLKSALRGEEPAPKRVKPRPVKKPVAVELDADEPDDDAPISNSIADPAALALAETEAAPQLSLFADQPAEPALHTEPVPTTVKLPQEAGEAHPNHKAGETDREELAKLIRPATGTIAKTATTSAKGDPDHG